MGLLPGKTHMDLRATWAQPLQRHISSEMVSTAKFHSLLVFPFTFSLCFYNTTSNGDGTRMAGYVFIRVYTLGEAAQEHGLMALCVFSTIKLLAARDPVPSVKSDSHSLQPLWGWDSGEQQG